MRALAFDHGGKRTGVAVGDSLTGTASPLPTLKPDDWPGIARLIAQWQPEVLVVGLPLDEDGGEQPATAAARRFVHALAAQTGLPVQTCDERYSSRAADDWLRKARASGHMSRRVRKGDRDAQSARVILEQWFQEQAAAGR